MMDLDEIFREEAEKYKNSKSVEVYEEQLEWWFKIIDDLREKNKKLSRNWEEEIEACMGWWKKANELEEENKKLKEIIRKAKEFEYDEDGMDYIYQNTEDIK